MLVLIGSRTPYIAQVQFLSRLHYIVMLYVNMYTLFVFFSEEKIVKYKMAQLGYKIL